MTFKTIIWDWNGTLLSDVSTCIEAMNKMLAMRNLPLLDETRYRHIFTFPVKDYYGQLGFDSLTDPFEKIGLEFIGYFKERLHEAPLQQGAEALLQGIRQNGIKQFILSAMEQHALVESVKHLNIHHWFDEIHGIDNDYGGGKLHLAQQVAVLHNLYGTDHLLIGDTLHDAEVAKAAGWSCVLVASGHQTADRLKQAGVAVFNNLDEVGLWLRSTNSPD